MLCFACSTLAWKIVNLTLLFIQENIKEKTSVLSFHPQCGMFVQRPSILRTSIYRSAQKAARSKLALFCLPEMNTHKVVPIRLYRRKKVIIEEYEKKLLKEYMLTKYESFPYLS